MMGLLLIEMTVKQKEQRNIVTEREDLRNLLQLPRQPLRQQKEAFLEMVEKLQMIDGSKMRSR